MKWYNPARDGYVTNSPEAVRSAKGQIRIMLFQARIALLSMLLLFTMAFKLKADSPGKQASNLPADNQAKSNVKNADELYAEAVEFTRSSRNLAARIKLGEAIKLWKQTGRLDRAATALLEITAQFETKGWFQDAVENYRDVLSYATLASHLKSDVSASLAGLYFRLHQLDLALKYYTQALNIERPFGNTSTQALCLAGIAAVKAKEGKFKDSLTYLLRATKIISTGKNERKKAEILWLIGYAYKTQDLKAEAIAAFQQALSLYEKASNTDQQRALLLSELSNLCVSLGEKQSAIAYAEKAKNIAEALATPEPRWHSWLALGKAQKASGQTTNALNSFYRAFSFIEQQAINLSSDSLKVSFMQERLSPYHQLVSTLVEMGKYSEALKIVEHSRARAALDALSTSPNEKTDRGQLQELREMNNMIAALNAELNPLEPDSNRRPAIESAIEDIELRRKELIIQTESDRFKRFTAPAALKHIQEETLQKGEALLEFFIGEDRSYVWLVSADEVKCEVIANREMIEKSVAQYLSLITKRPANLHIEKELSRQRSAGSMLFDMLLGNLKNNLKPVDRLIIIPDGVLYNLPFESLICDERFLIEKHAITYCFSASIFSLLRQTKSRDSISDRMDLLAFGDPSLDNFNLHRFGIGGGLGNKHAALQQFGLNNLPAARDEVEYIGHVFEPGKTRVYLRANATETAFKREAGNGYRRLHIATHTLINEVLPAHSGILFAPGKSGDDDGFLGLDEIRGLNLKGCELIVLSSCRTGRGQLVGGEGLIGLGRAFMLAGVRAVTMSLWNVSDISTANFMKKFYRKMADGAAVGESLREAKLQMIQSRSTTHPFYWAGFVLEGNPE